MFLSEAVAGKKYKVKNFGKIKEEEVLNFYEQGFIEGEEISVKDDIKTISKISLFRIDGNVFSINTSFTKEIEVEEIYE